MLIDYTKLLILYVNLYPTLVRMSAWDMLKVTMADRTGFHTIGYWSFLQGLPWSFDSINTTSMMSRYALQI